MGLDIYVRSTKQKQDDIETNWRKVNFVMGYLAKHDIYAQEINCTDVNLTKDMTLELLENCKTILNSKQENENWIELAKEILPTYPGFFFGSYDYDDWYVEDLEFVVSTITNLYKRYKTYELILHIWY